MEKLYGLGKTERKRLREVIRATKGTISVAEVAQILRTTRSSAAKMLAKWAAKSWLSRVRRGLYVPVPLESRTPNVPLEEPWLIAERLYAPCYIGGWSAAEYWGLTEQIFRSILVLTERKPRQRTLVMRNTEFVVGTVPAKAMFGLKPVWKGRVRVSVSDPTRTVVDMLADPALGGGIRPTVDVFLNYLKLEYRDTELLISYVQRLGNGAAFKRLGFLLERFAANEQEAISMAKAAMTTGNARLDPALPADRLVTRWRLWVPENWAKGTTFD